MNEIYFCLSFLYMFLQFDVQFGVLLSCFVANSNPPGNHRLLQKLEPLLSESGEPCMNEFDCPLLTLTYDLCLIPVSCVSKTISIAHHCTQDCKFVGNVTSIQVEREPVTSSKLIFLHDLSNRTYCYNIFCISNNYC